MMFAQARRLRLSRETEERGNGFTLIELLVVIIIIGILAGIAIPVFLNQRKKGVDASMKQDARNLSTAFETWYAGAGNYTYPAVITISIGAPTSVTIGSDSTWMSPGNLPDVKFYDRNGNMFDPNAQTLVTSSGLPFVGGTVTQYCIKVLRGSGAAKGSQDAWVYDSIKGGLQPAGVEKCPLE